MRTLLRMHMENGSIKTIGAISDNILYTTRKPEHFMVMYQGFGLSQAVIDRLLQLKIDNVIITYLGKETHKYKVSVQQYVDSRKTHLFGNGDKQKFVSVKDMVEL